MLLLAIIAIFTCTSAAPLAHFHIWGETLFTSTYLVPTFSGSMPYLVVDLVRQSVVNETIFGQAAVFNQSTMISSPVQYEPHEGNMLAVGCGYGVHMLDRYILWIGGNGGGDPGINPGIAGSGEEDVHMYDSNTHFAGC
jgi:hypothetical protein